MTDIVNFYFSTEEILFLKIVFLRTVSHEACFGVQNSVAKEVRLSPHSTISPIDKNRVFVAA